jgi:hypothetical protein
MIQQQRLTAVIPDAARGLLGWSHAISDWIAHET